MMEVESVSVSVVLPVVEEHLTQGPVQGGEGSTEAPPASTESTAPTELPAR